MFPLIGFVDQQGLNNIVSKLVPIIVLIVIGYSISLFIGYPIIGNMIITLKEITRKNTPFPNEKIYQKEIVDQFLKINTTNELYIKEMKINTTNELYIKEMKKFTKKK